VVARFPDTEEVASSNLASPTKRSVDESRSAFFSTLSQLLDCGQTRTCPMASRLECTPVHRHISANLDDLLR